MAEAVQFGQYQLVKKLAAGGMAQVWLARKPGIEGFQKNLVIKQVLTHLAGDESFVSMFLDEARLAAGLNHPNVVQVFDLGQVDESYFIAMEYIHGEDLRRLDRESRRARKPIPVELVCRIIADAAAGLHYAHTISTDDGRPKGIVHRDISPQNIIVTFEGGVKVVDFGIAKAADRANKTRAGVLKGKYAYMSPEQATAREVDARTDVFALGILLHELLTGRRLFKREGDVATLHAVVTCDVAPPSVLNPVVPPQLDPIVLSALQRDPARRTPDAGTLQMELEDFLLTNRLPASTPRLRAYMRDLFAERLEIEDREGGPAGYLVQRATGASGSMLGSSMPSMSRRDQQTFAQRPVRSPIDATPSGSVRITPPTAAPADAPTPELLRNIDDEVPVEDSGSGTGRGAGSVTSFAADMKRGRMFAMVAVGAVLGAGVLAGALVLSSDRGEDREGQVPARLAGLGATGEGDRIDSGPAIQSESASSAGDAGTGVGAREGAEVGQGGEVTPPPSNGTIEQGAVAGSQTQQRRPRPAAAAGTLRAEIRPAAARVQVRVGRSWRDVGTSGLSLAPGSHQLRVTLPDGATKNDQVEVLAGQVQTYERSFSKGSLRVVIQPFGSGGEVRVGGRVVATVPGPPAELFEGRHEVEIVGLDGRRKTEVVVIRAGALTNLTVSLD